MRECAGRGYAFRVFWGAGKVAQHIAIAALAGFLCSASAFAATAPAPARRKRECVVTMREHRVHHIHVPLVTFDDAFKERAGAFTVRHPHTTIPDNLDPLAIQQRPGAMR